MASRQLYAMLLILCLLQSRRAINKQQRPHTFCPCRPIPTTTIRSFSTALRLVPHPICMTLRTRCHTRDCWQQLQRPRCALKRTIDPPPSPILLVTYLEFRVSICQDFTRFRRPLLVFDRRHLVRLSFRFNDRNK